MSSIFQPITLEWRDKRYVIPAERVMRAIAIVENHITLLELQRAAVNGSAPLAKIAGAFADVINYAGGTLSAEEVYLGMFGDGADVLKIQLAVVTLLQMMVPPDAAKALTVTVEEGEDAVKKSKAAERSSKRRSRRPTHGDSNQRNSGA
jgi:hypothetical protein